MIKYNESTINDWFLSTDNIIKVYRNNAVCYYKVITSGGTSGQTPCFAVVDNISQYQETEFEDVFNKADGKWYKLNNLDEYEEYGVYGSGRNVTTYEGKLTIDDGYEYMYSGGSWINVGEVSGSTATLPDIPFVLNYNAKNYDAATHSIPMTSGQLNDTDAVAYNNPNNIVDHSADGYITVSNSSMRIRKQGQDISLFNRSSNSTSSDLTIVCKAKTTSGENIITNRDDNYNWMYRLKTSGNLRFHGTSETSSIAWNISNPDIMSVRTYYDSGTKLKYNNWTQNTSTTPTSFTYGSTNGDSSSAGALFVGYGWNLANEQWSGDFYWVYMAQANLTDAQIQEVIDYNEGGGGQSEYPLYYDEIADPPNNLSFSSMTEAEEYECPWVGMRVTIDGDRYVFSGDSTSGYEWVEITSPIPPEYQELKYFTVPREYRTKTSSNLFSVPVDLQVNYKYVFDFTPVNFWGISYYGVILGGNDADTNFNDLGLFKLDNGWGNSRFMASLLNYQLGRTKFSLYPYIIEDARTVISMHMNDYVANNGATISIESNGVEVFTGSSTTKASSSYNPTIGIRNVPLLDMGTSGNNVYTANLKFHNFAVKTSSDTLVYDYRPVERLSDGQVGVFDTVNQIFYPLQGYTVTKGEPV